MSCTTTIFLLYLFVYTTTGIPLHDESKQIVGLSLIPSQWVKDSEISNHWPKGEVPYVFDDKSYDDGVKARVRIAMAALERDSCIRFKEQKEGDGTWLHFTNPDKQRQCFHESSYQAKGEIQVVLGYDCLKQRDIMHSVLHGVGFRDEISHPQRDLFVKIMWGNIQPAYKPMFRIQPVQNAGGLVEYDPMSIMHFHDRAYSQNGQATITPLLPGLKIAPSDKLSHLDKMKLRIMFGHECNKRKVGEVLDKCKGILTQYDESELTTVKPEDANSPNNEDVKDDPSGNNSDDPSVNNGDDPGINKGDDPSANNGDDPSGNNGDDDPSGNNGDDPNGNNGDDTGVNNGDDPNGNNGDDPSGNNNDDPMIDPNAGDNNDGGKEMDQDGGQEDIVDPNAIGNNGGDEEIPKIGAEEVIIVGNNANGNNDEEMATNGVQEDIVDSNASGNNNGDEKITKNAAEETIIVGNNDNKIEEINIGPAEQMRNTEDEAGNRINLDIKDAEQPNEAIIVGNDKTSNSPRPDDLTGKIVYNGDVAQDVE